MTLEEILDDMDYVLSSGSSDSSYYEEYIIDWHKQLTKLKKEQDERDTNPFLGPSIHPESRTINGF